MVQPHAPRAQHPLRAPRRAPTRGLTLVELLIAIALIALLLATALTACGSNPPPTVDREGLRDRADQETDQL